MLFGLNIFLLYNIQVMIFLFIQVYGNCLQCALLFVEGRPLVGFAAHLHRLGRVLLEVTHVAQLGPQP